jgi:cell division protein FtsQ
MKTRAAPAQSGKRKPRRHPSRMRVAHRRKRGFGGAARDGLTHLIKRLKNSLSFRRPVLMLTLTLMAAGTAAGIFAGGHVAKTIADTQVKIESALAAVGFSVQEIALTGEERTDVAAAYAALGVVKGDSIFAFDPALARERLLRLPWVADAEVRRQLPDTVVVRLVEKRPFALWQNGNRVAVIERSGAVITTNGSNDLPRLPLVVGPGAPEAAANLIDALGTEKAVSARVAAVERIGERRWDLLLSGGVTVRLPEDGWKTELSELENLIVEKGVLERDIEMIDLRYRDNYIFRLHNGDSRPIPRERHA